MGYPHSEVLTAFFFCGVLYLFIATITILVRRYINKRLTLHVYREIKIDTTIYFNHKLFGWRVHLGWLGCFGPAGSTRPDLGLELEHILL